MDLVKIRKKAQKERAKNDKAGARTMVEQSGREGSPQPGPSISPSAAVPDPVTPAVRPPEHAVQSSGESLTDDHVQQPEIIPEGMAAAPPIPEGLRGPDGPVTSGVFRTEETAPQSLVPSDVKSSKEFLQLATEELYKQSYLGVEEGEHLKVLCFRLSTEEYAIPVTGVREIIRPRDITEVPRVPGYILGIISLRGIVVPVFDLRKRLGLPDKEMTRSTRIIIASDDVKTLGMVVDGVTQVIRIPSESVEPPPLVVGGIEGEFIQGVGRDQQRMIILLNLRRILDMDVSMEIKA